MKYVVLAASALMLASCGVKDLEAEVASLKGELTKVQKDSDGDGVADAFDLEPNTPKGALIDGSGRALDLDGDGVRHELDVDPFSQRGVRVDASGAEMDSDGDGVADSKDKEPNTPAGSLVNFQGKRIEVSGGISNSVASAFIPEVMFATNSVTVSADEEAKLAVVAKMLKANPNIRLQIIGHADKTGSEKTNLKVAERRAKAVLRVLTTTFSLPESRFEVVSKGENDPISKKNQHNRRVEFVVIK
ncbi:MAG: OmpA family protein [Schleiferiaceae bacterium]